MGDRIFAFSIAFLFLGLLPALSDADQLLYDDNDEKVLLLNGTTFQRTIVDTKNAWFVQFFNSWCGHCQAFAPVWKSLAHDVYGWKKIIRMAAIDCSQTINENTCKSYEVHKFPTLKFFKPNSGNKDFGILYMDKRNELILRKSMIDFVASLSGLLNLENSSNYKSEEKPESISFWEHIPDEVKVLILVAEENDSYAAKELYLDLLEHPEAKVIQILSEDIPLLKVVDIKKIPAIALLSRSIKHYNESVVDRRLLVSSVKSLLSISSGNDSNQDDLGGGDEGIGGGDVPQELTSVKTIDVRRDKIYMVDLENAIHYTFMHEVTLYKNLNRENLEALKNFTHLLTKYFPGRKPVKNFLKKLFDWMSSFQSALNMDDYMHFIEISQNTNSFIPSMQTWTGCQGSQPHLRGYPCSLWVLFHTLTVEYYNRSSKEKTFDNQLVLKVMTAYIKNFFSCQECAQHFQDMAAHFPEEVVEKIDGVLWLWRAHNKVNARLKGTPSEDPQFPKQQFPSTELCSSCQTSEKNGIQWNIEEVSTFLTKHYSRANIIKQSLSTFNETAYRLQRENKLLSGHTKEIQEDSLSRSVNRNQRSINMHGNFQKLSDSLVSETQQKTVSSWGFNSLDMSLCVMLYICSTGILLTVYFVVIVKRRLRKKLPFYSSKYSV